MKRQKVLVQCIVNGEEVAEYVDPRSDSLGSTYSATSSPFTIHCTSTFCLFMPFHLH